MNAIYKIYWWFEANPCVSLRMPCQDARLFPSWSFEWYWFDKEERLERVKCRSTSRSSNPQSTLPINNLTRTGLEQDLLALCFVFDLNPHLFLSVRDINGTGDSSQYLAGDFWWNGAINSSCTQNKPCLALWFELSGLCKRLIERIVMAKAFIHLTRIVFWLPLHVHREHIVSYGLH